MTDWLIGVTTALVAAIISFQHAYELVSTHGEIGVTIRLAPFTVDGLILAASMLTLDANRRDRRHR
jgi:ABC-type spermidine/putrescine transport system permease subunit II